MIDAYTGLLIWAVVAIPTAVVIGVAAARRHG